MLRMIHITTERVRLIHIRHMMLRLIHVTQDHVTDDPHKTDRVRLIQIRHIMLRLIHVTKDHVTVDSHNKQPSPACTKLQISTLSTPICTPQTSRSAVFTKTLQGL